MLWFLFFLLTVFLSRCFSLAPSPYDDPCLEGSTVDILYALDTTWSMKSSLGYVKEHLPQLMRGFVERLPESRFGLLTFNDEDTECQKGRKQHWNNYGVRLDLKLTSNFTEMEEHLQKYTASNGDLFEPEDSMGALLVSALDEGVGWRNDLKENYYRVVVVLTDAPYRFPGDQNAVCTANQREENDGDGFYDYKSEMYPTTDQVMKALKEKNILPLFVSLDNPHGINYKDVYDQLLKQWNIGGATASGKNSDELIDKVPDYIRNIICLHSPDVISPTAVSGMVLGAVAAVAAVASLVAHLATPVITPMEGHFENEEMPDIPDASDDLAVIATADEFA